jgi:hypothetical protein
MTANGQFVIFGCKTDLNFQSSGPKTTAFPSVTKLFFMDLTNFIQNGVVTQDPRLSISPLYVPGGWEPDADCTNASVSENGRFVVFQAALTNATGVTQTTPPTQQVWVMDLNLGIVSPKLLSPSKTVAGQVCSADATLPQISGDGSTVVFMSSAADLVTPAPPVGIRQIYAVAPAGTGMDIVSRTTNGPPGPNPGAPADNHCGFPAVSNTGQFVSFDYLGGTMMPGTAGAAAGVVARRDRVNGVTDLVSLDGFDLAIFGGPGIGDRTGISADGRYVSFSGFNSAQTDIQVQVRDMMGGTIGASHHIIDPGTTFQSFPNQRISADGRWVAWESDSKIEVVGDTNGVRDVFGFGPVHP